MEHDVKERAVNNFIELVIAKNKSLGEKLKRNRAYIYGRALAYIQQIGVHDYSEKVLKRNSDHRNELVDLIDEE